MICYAMIGDKGSSWWIGSNVIESTVCSLTVFALSASEPNRRRDGRRGEGRKAVVDECMGTLVTT